MTRGFGAKMGQIFGKNFGFFSLLLSSLFSKREKRMIIQCFYLVKGNWFDHINSCQSIPIFTVQI
jgi:hypothetical protein